MAQYLAAKRQHADSLRIANTSCVTRRTAPRHMHEDLDQAVELEPVLRVGPDPATHVEQVPAVPDAGSKRSQ